MRTGQVIGAYQLGEVLASGGMGVVHRATRLGTEDALAIKLLRADADQDGERRRRFVREAKVVAGLDHPGIVRVHEIGDEGGEIFIVMDLVEGQSLRSWIDDGRARAARPDVGAALGLARGIAEAVAYAHGQGIVHRDLKPDNVMVAPDGSVRVLDFGLAKMREIEGSAVYAAETETSLTNEGRVLGTPGYMAPEQASGKEVGYRADVFALGAILYELLTASRAFTGSSAMDILVSLARDNPAPPSTRNPAVPPALDALVERCLAKDPNARPTMEELVHELARPSLATSSRPARAWRVRAGVVVLVAGVLVAVIGLRAARLGAASPRGPAPITSSPPVVVPTAVTDLPLPASANAAALATYQSAVGHERDGAEDATLEELERATQQDPQLAAAHLRLALRLAYTESQRAHVHFAHAVKNRGALSPRDQAVLDAAQPLFQRDPADGEAWERAVSALAEKWPGDAELAYEVGVARYNVGNFAGYVESSQRAIALDPRFGLARAGLAEGQAYLGQFDAARSTVAQCIANSPSATWCLWVTEYVDTVQGRCSDASARARIAIDPSLAGSYLELYYALSAKGRDTPGAREAAQMVTQRFPDDRARKYGLTLNLRLDELGGDFVSAARRAAELREYAAKSSDTPNRSRAAIFSSEIAVETGRTAEAGTYAKEFLDRHDVWQSAPIASDYSLADDSVPNIVSFAYHAGSVSKPEMDRTLEAWRANWRGLLRRDYQPYLWIYGYASVVETREEALRAVAELPGYLPIPPFVPNGWLPLAAVGRTFWLAGREDEGLAYLRSAAHSCSAGVHPIPWIRAHAWLAEALAKRGDVAAACVENDVVLQTWGDAKPRSVTAEAARVRARSLGCKAIVGR